MNLASNNLQRLRCHKKQTNKQTVTILAASATTTNTTAVTTASTITAIATATIFPETATPTHSKTVITTIASTTNATSSVPVYENNFHFLRPFGHPKLLRAAKRSCAQHRT